MATEIEQLKKERHSCVVIITALEQVLPKLKTLTSLKDKETAKSKLTKKVLETMLDNFDVHYSTIKQEHERLNNEVIALNKQ